MESKPTEPTSHVVLGAVGGGLLLGGTAMGAIAVVTTPWLFIPAGALALGSGVVFLVRSTMAAVRRTSRGGAPAAAPKIGLGTDIDASARIEPGAVVEMGASVLAGAIIRSGAVVRMGATVGKNATIEKNAVVGWGVTVEEGATVEAGASVGAGATVGKNARVHAGAHVGAGSTIQASRADREARSSRTTARTEADAQVEASTDDDPRLSKLEQLCDRLAAELAKGSPALRNFLSTTERSIESLRQMSRDLVAREQGLRREVSPELLARLERERAALQTRIAAAQDEQVRSSLQKAAAAIDEQRAQRSQLALNAERLDAELTRLTWSIEGIIAQLVRVNAQGGVATDPELERGLGQVRDELAAVQEALEAVNAQERSGLAPSGVAPVSAVTSDEATSPAAPGRVRS